MYYNNSKEREGERERELGDGQKLILLKSIYEYIDNPIEDTKIHTHS